MLSEDPTRTTPSTRDETGTHSRTAALLLLLVLSLIWGVHWVVVKVGLQYMPPFTYGALRVASGLGTLVVLLGARRQLALPPRRDLSLLASVGLGHIAASVALMNLALQVVPAGRSSVLLYTMPLWVAVIQFGVFRVRPRPTEVVGLFLGLTGIAALLNPVSIEWATPGQLTGGLELLVAACAWAIATIHVRRHHWATTPLRMQPWLLGVALVPLVILAITLEPNASIRWTPTTVAALLFSGPLATAFAFWAGQSITRSLGSLTSATGFLAAPVVGLASGALLLGEPLGFLDLVGFGFVLAGIALASVPKPAVG